MTDRGRPKTSTPARRAALWAALTGIVAGAIAMFILDPQQGRRRRALARDKVVKWRNTADRAISEDLPARARYLSGFANGLRHKAGVLLLGGERPAPNEAVLVDRVLSTVFRDPDLPKGEVNVDASGSTVILRGSVEENEMRDRIEQRVRSVEGVYDVVNLINKSGPYGSSVRQS